MNSILDPKDTTGKYPFEWVKADDTDIRKTFERVKKAAPQVSTLRDANRTPGRSEPAVAAPNIQSLSLWRKA